MWGGVDLAIDSQCNAAMPKALLSAGDLMHGVWGWSLKAGTVAGRVEGGEAVDSKILQTLLQKGTSQAFSTVLAAASVALAAAKAACSAWCVLSSKALLAWTAAMRQAAIASGVAS